MKSIRPLATGSWYANAFQESKIGKIGKGT